LGEEGGELGEEGEEEGKVCEEEGKVGEAAGVEVVVSKETVEFKGTDWGEVVEIVGGEIVLVVGRAGGAGEAVVVVMGMKVDGVVILKLEWVHEGMVGSVKSVMP
jgi:hypothetical protein